MESLFLLIPLSIGIVFVAIWVFFGASDGGQFDDLVGPGLRILHDDDSGMPADADANGAAAAAGAAQSDSAAAGIATGQARQAPENRTQR